MRGFNFGPWSVIPERGLLRDGSIERHLEPLVMDVFVVLASHHGEVVTKDQLIDEVWDGRPQTDDVITRCVSALRKGLADDARAPKYIETVQRRGYRIMIPVSMPEQPSNTGPASPSASRLEFGMIAVGFIGVAAIAWFALTRGPAPEQGQRVASVAVFPFECLLDAREAGEHLCFGFAEEAISSLKQIQDMQVVRKREPYAAEASDEDGLVTGSVQIIADRVKIAAQLEDRRSGLVIWSETFDTDKTGIFDLQRRVADGLHGALDAGFSPQKSGRREPANYAAAEAYALGRYLFRRRDHQTVEAIAKFEEAIRLDPTYGPAWLGLAYSYSIWPDYDLTINRRETFDRALEIMDEGVRADPSIREAAGTVYGYIYLKQNKWEEAITNTGMAINSGTAEAEAYDWHSRVLASVGRLDESLESVRKGVAIDPEYAAMMSRMAIASFWVNDIKGARRYFEIADRMDFRASIHSLTYSWFLLRTGDLEAAKARAKLGLQSNNLDSSWVEPVFDGIVDVDKREHAVAVVDQMYASAALTDNVAITLWVLLGEPDKAMRAARKSEGVGALFEVEIIYTDEFREFRRHPEFGDFLAGVGLTRYWEGAGCTWSDDKVICEN
jgi:DNA-binding winged helix-turn-helix (wHTH) protein/TolB-like protein/Tfp pilus assembly protein PilF